MSSQLNSISIDSKMVEENFESGTRTNRDLINTYRYKFTEEFMSELHNFSKIHQYDDRKDFKEAWTTWTDDKEDIIYEESERLKQMGYEGDILDKMFKSARYYFRKKSTEKKEPKKRRQYIIINHELIDAMDQHISASICNNSYQPKLGFLDFCKINESLIKETVNNINQKDTIDKELIEEKIKKTYKNRYYIFTTNNK